MFSSEEAAMTRIIDTTSKHSLSAKLVAGFAISAILALGNLSEPSSIPSFFQT
jgi:hypothetical protein